MPKGRNKWVAELYIKRSSLVLGVQAHSDSLALACWRTGKSQKGSLPASTKHSEPSIWISRAGILDTAVQISNFNILFLRPPLHSASQRPHICATVHHGDQHGQAACPFAAFGDGGVPPVSGYSLCLQGRATGAPPPLRPVRHHRGGGGGGLLQSGGGPGPEVVLADRGEPEEEHQMSPFIIAEWHLCEEQPMSWTQTDEADPDSQAERAWTRRKKRLMVTINKLRQTAWTEKSCFHLSLQLFLYIVFFCYNIPVIFPLNIYFVYFLLNVT